MEQINPQNLSPAALAYLGDAVIELMARELVIASGFSDAGELNKLARSFVTATAQSAAFERVKDVLTESETASYKRGRNHSSQSAPRSASVAEYRRATGMEALFATLYLRGERARMRELFAIAFGVCETDAENGEKTSPEKERKTI